MKTLNMLTTWFLVLIIATVCLAGAGLLCRLLFIVFHFGWSAF